MRRFLLKALLILTLLGVFGAAGVAAWIWFALVPVLPDTEELQDVRLQVPLRVYSRDGALLAEFGEQRRVPVVYSEIPERLVNAFLSAEDDRFFVHPGVDYHGLLRAAYTLATTGEKKQGGSTITMQVARNFFLSRKKSYLRKINEILLALKIEREFSKEKIFELYVNKIYLGHRAYGIGSAAQVYYGAELKDLTLPQIAMIAGLPKAPSAYNPISNPPRAKLRRNYVLGRMKDLGYINEAEYNEAVAAPVVARLHGPQVDLPAGYVAEMARAWMLDKYGEEATYTDGMKVYLSIDSKLQRAAQDGLRAALVNYDRRHGWRGAEAHIETLPDNDAGLDDLLAPYQKLGALRAGIVLANPEKTAQIYLRGGERIDLPWDAIKWTRPYIDENRRGAVPKQSSDVLAVGDVIRVFEDPEDGWQLGQVPAVAGAIVSLSPHDGGINALAGGFDFDLSKFNRAIQAQRQAGSGLKPFIYSAALDKGMTVATLINDAPVVFNDPSLEGSWRPENYSGKVFGPTRLRVALYNSRNLVSIRVLRQTGVDHTSAYLERIGFDPNRIPHNLSLALGSAQVTPLEMAAAQSVWANGGFRIEPWLILRVEDTRGDTLYQADPAVVCRSCDYPDLTQATNDGSLEDEPTGEQPVAASAEGSDAPKPHLAPRVVEARNAYLIYSMMRDVVKRGTARRALALGRDDLAGKTGTTNDQRDAWFSGYNADMVTIAWVGFDQMDPMGRGEVGGRAALPAWMNYMKVALDGRPAAYVPEPPGLVRVRIDPETGEPADPANPAAEFEIFRAEYAPKSTPRGRSTLPSVVPTPSVVDQPGTPDAPRPSGTLDGGLF
ncbi:MAG: penicillin-binding protein 1A [Gammaproteobacteria bacterium]|nr:penicillin-binding protein 1A [Gammaproteobacteria bacterium]MCP5138202.1 penicillin-binding protein 1A [Gammaproteobacteria bacterium]